MKLRKTISFRIASKGIFENGFMRKSSRPLLWKKNIANRKLKRSKINTETFHIQALERSVSLRW